VSLMQSDYNSIENTILRFKFLLDTFKLSNYNFDKSLTVDNIFPGCLKFATLWKIVRSCHFSLSKKLSQVGVLIFETWAHYVRCKRTEGACFQQSVLRRALPGTRTWRGAQGAWERARAAWRTRTGSPLKTLRDTTTPRPPSHHH
jgi:hypothetical protein